MSSEEDVDTFIEKKVETTPGKIDKKTGTVISTEKKEVTFSEQKQTRGNLLQQYHCSQRDRSTLR